MPKPQSTGASPNSQSSPPALDLGKIASGCSCGERRARERTGLQETAPVRVINLSHAILLQNASGLVAGDVIAPLAASQELLSLLHPCSMRGKPSFKHFVLKTEHRFHLPSRYGSS
jgi:hypothetical protein